MNRIPVVSSDLKSVGYDPVARVLEVEFKNESSVYQYSNVPAELYNALMLASSKGRFFGAKIRPYPQRYPYRKIR